MTTDFLDRLAALLETVVNPGMVATAQQTRDRGIIEAMIEMAQEQEAYKTNIVFFADMLQIFEQRLTALDQQSANRTATLVEALEKQDVEIALLRARIAALEAWKEQMTGDGK